MTMPAPSSPLAAAQALDGGLVPPGLFVRGDECIRVTSFNSAASVELAIESLQYIAGSGPQWSRDRHVPNTDRTSATTIVRLAEGWLSALTVRASAGAPRRGQCFVIVEIGRGTADANFSPLGVLVQGYVTDTQRRGYPSSPLEMSTQGEGVIRLVTGTDPAANTEVSETVPTNARWRVLAIHLTFVTDANVANREPALVIDDGATVFHRQPVGTNIAASLTTRLTYAAHFITLALVNDRSGIYGFPSYILPGGFRIRTITTNLQVTDNYGAPQLLVEEWIED